MIQIDWLVVAGDELKEIVAFGFTVMVPESEAAEQPPEVVTV